MSSVRTQWRSLGYFLVILAIAGTLVGCQEDKITLPDCHLVDGVVSVQMAEGVRADSARRALSSVGLPYDTTQVVDFFITYFEVTSGEPRERSQALGATDAGVFGVWHDGRVFASFCDRDSSWVVQVGSGVPGLRYDHTWWYQIDTIVTVPVGQEDEWVLRFQGLAFVAHAQRMTWCPI